MGRRREQAKGESGGDGCPTQVLITRNSLPVQAGLVVSLARPGGNATRASLMGGALGVKRVGLLRELVPDATAFAVLANPNNSNSRPDVSDVETAVRTAGLRPIILQASTTAELDAAFAKLLKERANALVVTADPFFTLHVAGRSLFDVRACDFAQFLQVYAFAHFGEFEAQPAANRGEAGPGYARVIVQ